MNKRKLHNKLGDTKLIGKSERTAGKVKKVIIGLSSVATVTLLVVGIKMGANFYTSYQQAKEVKNSQNVVQNIQTETTSLKENTTKTIQIKQENYSTKIEFENGNTLTSTPVIKQEEVENFVIEATPENSTKENDASETLPEENKVEENNNIEVVEEVEVAKVAPAPIIPNKPIVKSIETSYTKTEITGSINIDKSLLNQEQENIVTSEVVEPQQEVEEPQQEVVETPSTNEETQELTTEITETYTTQKATAEVGVEGFASNNGIGVKESIEASIPLSDSNRVDVLTNFNVLSKMQNVNVEIKDTQKFSNGTELSIGGKINLNTTDKTNQKFTYDAGLGVSNIPINDKKNISLDIGANFEHQDVGNANKLLGQIDTKTKFNSSDASLSGAISQNEFTTGLAGNKKFVLNNGNEIGVGGGIAVNTNNGTTKGLVGAGYTDNQTGIYVKGNVGFQASQDSASPVGEIVAGIKANNENIGYNIYGGIGYDGKSTTGKLGVSLPIGGSKKVNNNSIVDSKDLVKQTAGFVSFDSSKGQTPITPTTPDKPSQPDQPQDDKNNINHDTSTPPSVPEFEF